MRAAADEKNIRANLQIGVDQERVRSAGLSIKHVLPPLLVADFIVSTCQ